jgi:hypothetical protein
MLLTTDRKLVEKSRAFVQADSDSVTPDPLATSRRDRLLMSHHSLELFGVGATLN